MIGLVIVSHSATLAEGVCQLARQASHGQVPIAAAGGTADPENPIGTDACRVLQAIEAVDTGEGVLVLMDLGSAVLSAETALDLIDAARRPRVVLCPAPLVEGAVAAASLAAAGAAMAEIAREARQALAGKLAQLDGGGEPAPVPSLADAGLGGEGPCQEDTVTIPNRLGLHARPAAQLVRLARHFSARVTLENLSRDSAPAAADSINAILSLGARQGHRLRIRAHGPAAPDALAALAHFLESGSGEMEKAAPELPGRRRQSPAPPSPRQLSGIPAAAGIAIGPLLKLRSAAPLAPRAGGDPEEERQRLRTAIEAAQAETRTLYEWSQAHLGADAAGVFDAQLLFLEDPGLLAAVERRLAVERAGAEIAWQAETTAFAGRLGALDDPHLSARAADVADVAERVLRRLTGQTGAAVLRQPAILTAHDLTPSEVASLDPALALGVCLETGSASAHSVILARARGIPVVAGLGPALSALADGTLAAMDGEQGVVWIAPDAAQAHSLAERREGWLAARRAAERERAKPAATRDGRPIRVLANISGVAEAAEAVDSGAQGVGVLRTEFLFLARAAAPGEEEQLAAYRAIAESLGGRPLTIRALDVGGDKRVPYIDTGEEANPFLGWRGIRVLLSRRDLFRTQLRAILRAGAGRAVELLLPMIASLDELRAAKALLGEVEAELGREGLPFRPGMPIGVMIEVPAAVAIAGSLAREAAFFSIGSNDLIQYTMAADRTNSRVAPLADPFDPAVLRMIRQTVEAGRDAGIGVTLCGELAADPAAAPLLLGLGIEEFSLSAPLIPELKRALAAWSTAEAADVAREALALESAPAVRRLLQEAGGRFRGPNPEPRTGP